VNLHQLLEAAAPTFDNLTGKDIGLHPHIFGAPFVAVRWKIGGNNGQALVDFPAGKPPIVSTRGEDTERAFIAANKSLLIDFASNLLLQAVALGTDFTGARDRPSKYKPVSSQALARGILSWYKTVNHKMMTNLLATVKAVGGHLPADVVAAVGKSIGVTRVVELKKRIASTKASLAKMEAELAELEAK